MKGMKCSHSPRSPVVYISYLIQPFSRFLLTSATVAVAGDTGFYKNTNSKIETLLFIGSVGGKRENCKVCSNFRHGPGMTSSIMGSTMETTMWCHHNFLHYAFYGNTCQYIEKDVGHAALFYWMWIEKHEDIKYQNIINPSTLWLH